MEAIYNNMFLIKDGDIPEIGRNVLVYILLENGNVLVLYCFTEHLMTGISIAFKDLVSGAYYPDNQIAFWRYASDVEVDIHGN